VGGCEEGEGEVIWEVCGEVCLGWGGLWGEVGKGEWGKMKGKAKGKRDVHPTQRSSLEQH
jgi:hypothetical protein